MIFSAFISTLSVEALSHIIGLSTSREVWLTLETLFSAQSQSRIMQLTQQVATLKKWVLSISAYYQKAQGFSDLLAAVGKPIEASEFVSNILAGLGVALACGKATVESRIGWALTLGSVGSGDRQINRWFVLLWTHLIKEHKTVEFVGRDEVLAGGQRGDKRIIFGTKTSKDVGDEFWCFNGFSNSN
jgi:hypothetical protein